MDVVDTAPTSAPLLGEPLPVELMNTIWADRDGVHDALASTADAAAWLHATATEPGRISRPAADRLRSLRDALRALAAEVTGDPRPAADPTPHAAAVAVLNETCALAPAWSKVHWPSGGEPERTRASAGRQAELALAGLAEQAVELFTGSARERLRPCLAPGCVLYFVREHPRREWCSAGCGNRARVARHYQRHHQTG